MKRILWPVMGCFAILLLLQSCAKSTKVIVPQAIRVQGLFSLSGNWSSLGITSKSALELAQEDINKYLDGKDANFRISVAISDTKLETETARLLFVDAKDRGVKFVIGPQSSAEVAVIISEANAHNVLVVSQSSTAGNLAVPDDNVFRFCPSDRIEGAASGATIFKQGATGLVTVARNDAGNKGLQSATGAAFTAKGGEVSAIVPYAINTTNYASVIASIKAEVARLITSKGAGKVAVYLASFDEGIELFKLASAEPTLNSIKWYGGDGIVSSKALTGNAVAAEFAIKTGFFAPSFGLPTALQSKWQPIADRIKAKTGTDPDAYALAAYDALWTIAYTIEEAKGSITDFAKIKTLFVAQANKDTGITGAGALDAAGDRASGTFDYFGIVKDGAGYKWALVGKSDD